jgi:hypothetical protein
VSPEVRDSIVDNVACPACGAPVGVRCRTVIDGKDTGWTHDARVYADLFKPKNGDGA